MLESRLTCKIATGICCLRRPVPNSEVAVVKSRRGGHGNSLWLLVRWNDIGIFMLALMPWLNSKQHQGTWRFVIPPLVLITVEFGPPLKVSSMLWAIRWNAKPTPPMRLYGMIQFLSSYRTFLVKSLILRVFSRTSIVTYIHTEDHACLLFAFVFLKQLAFYIALMIQDLPLCTEAVFILRMHRQSLTLIRKWWNKKNLVGLYIL